MLFSCVSSQLEDEIQSIRDAATADAEKFDEVKSQLVEDKKVHREKCEEHQKARNAAKRQARDIDLLKTEIEKMKK